MKKMQRATYSICRCTKPELKLSEVGGGEGAEGGKEVGESEQVHFSVLIFALIFFFCSIFQIFKYLLLPLLLYQGRQGKVFL